MALQALSGFFGKFYLFSGTCVHQYIVHSFHVCLFNEFPYVFGQLGDCVVKVTVFVSCVKKPLVFQNVEKINMEAFKE